MRRFPLAVVGAAAFALVAAGCASDPVTDPDNDVTFTSCSSADCAGTLPSGAEFDIILPEDWNGTLAIYSHRIDGPGALPANEVPAQEEPATDEATSPPPGLGDDDAGDETKGAQDDQAPKKGKKDRAAATPSPTPVDPPVEPRPGGPELAPMWGRGDRTIADVMLQAGYAIAGATPSGQGWVVADQIQAAEELHQYFSDTIAEPNRVYVWGESTGGLASARLAQLHPDWVSGALAMCAPLSGPLQTFDLALDVAYATRELVAPELKLIGYASEDEARRNREVALRALQEAAEGPLAEQAKVAFIAGIGDLPNDSRTIAGATWPDQIEANLEAIGNLIDQSTVQRYDLEQRSGGNFSGNAGTDYALRISDIQRRQLDEVRKGLADAYLVKLGSGVRVTPDPAAVERAEQQGTLDGNLEVPTVTLHNSIDPVYIAPNVSSYRSLLATGDPETIGNLVEVFVLPPSSVSESDPAAEGVGNCNFESRTVLGAMIQLNQWVRNGVYPGRDTAQAAFKGQNVSLEYDPGPWPQMSATATETEAASAQLPGDAAGHEEDRS